MSQRRLAALVCAALLVVGPDLAAQGAVGAAPGALALLQERVQTVAAAVVPATVGIEVGRIRGSGCIVSEDGYILTAAHVFGEPNRPARVILHDGRVVRATTLGKQNRADYGLLKIVAEGETFPFAPLGASADLEEGALCLATGHPGGVVDERPPVLRLGVIGRTRGDFLRSTCVINSGDSGGPLFDLDGRLIGIHSRIRPRESQNYHVPIDRAVRNWKRLVAGESFDDGEGEYPSGPWLGVRIRDAEGGVVVEHVDEGGPASGSELRVGDVVTAFDGNAIATVDELIAAIRRRSPNDAVRLDVRRDGKPHRIEIVLGMKP